MNNVDEDTRAAIRTAIQHFLGVLQNQSGQALHDLAKALDALASTYHATPNVEPDTIEASPAPRPDERSITEAAAAAFPDLGWYALVDPEGGEDQGVGMSIATGDLAEIAADLLGVLWLFDKASFNDAVWEFRFGYQSLWGRHLHEIRTYLHSLAAW